jgi:signal peptidase I
LAVPLGGPCYFYSNYKPHYVSSNLIETLSFGKSLDTFLGIITFGLYIYYINYSKKLDYVADRSIHPQNKAADTVSSLLFAIIVATLVHTYLVQPYTIPHPP